MAAVAVTLIRRWGSNGATGTPPASSLVGVPLPADRSGWDLGRGGDSPLLPRP
jgi:hypothetical protein